MSLEHKLAFSLFLNGQTAHFSLFLLLFFILFLNGQTTNLIAQCMRYCHRNL